MSTTLYKFLAGIRKECLMLVRDLPGLAILFLMPLLLVLVVTLAQMAALKNQSPRTDLLLVDLEHSPASLAIASDLDSSGLYRLVTTYRDEALDTSLASRLTGEGKFPFAVIVGPSGKGITLISDPTLNPSYRNTILASLRFLITGSSLRIRMDELVTRFRSHSDSVARVAVAKALDRQLTAIESEMNRQFRKMSGNKNLPWITLDRGKIQDSKFKIQDLRTDDNRVADAGNPVRIHEVFAAADATNLRPTPIQNNVPGFILFAMFFLVIPLSASILAEKNEGAHQRLVTLPVSWLITLSSKVAVYLVVCLLQFVLMILMGTRFFPIFFGFPALEIGTSYAAIALVTIAAGLAAIGFGILVGTFTRTFGQAALFGSVMVVILGLVSGTFLPMQVMPAGIRYISFLSPVRWGIDAYLQLFVRGEGIPAVLPQILLLLLFFGLAMTISVFIFARRKEVS